MFVEGVPSLFHPIVPGVMTCFWLADVVITSAITPDPGNGSVFSLLPESADLDVASV